MTKRLWRLLLLGILGIGIVARHRYFDWCIHDDAFISFRYARNLVRGAGLVMNPGERVEGFTNFLWTLLAAPMYLLGIDPARGTQVIGAVLAVGMMLGAFLFTERRLGGGWFGLVAPVLLAFNLAFVMESLSGLETMAFVALVFAAYVAFLEERRNAATRPGLWAVWCGAATLVRPEGALVFAVLALWAGLGVARGEPSSRLARAALVYAALVVPLLAFRLVYYGDFVPNTFHVKVGFTTAQLARGWKYTRFAFAYTMTPALLVVALLLPPLGMWLDRRKPRLLAPVGVPAPVRPWTRLFARRPRDEALAVALVLCLAWVAYVIAIGGDYEPTGRFHMPVLVLFYLLFQEGVRTFVRWGAARGPTARAGVSRGSTARAGATLVALAVAAAGFALSENAVATVLDRRGWPQARRQHHDQLRAVGEWLRANTPPNALIAVSSIGALPYYADRPIVDMMGLTDRHIARRSMPGMGTGAAGHEKGDGAYVLERKPDAILLDKGHLFPTEVPVDQVMAGARGVSETEIVRDPRFAREYEMYATRISAGMLYGFARIGP